MLNRTYRVDGHNVHVLYEYNEFMEQLLFQYKEDQDIALAGLFLHGHPRLIRRLRKDSWQPWHPGRTKFWNRDLIR